MKYGQKDARKFREGKIWTAKNVKSVHPNKETQAIDESSLHRLACYFWSFCCFEEKQFTILRMLKSSGALCW